MFGALVAVFGRPLPERLKADALAAQGLIGAAFLAFILFTSDLFTRLFPAPFEGRDLNPILQDPGLAIHPPLLYLGYVGFSIVMLALIAPTLALAVRPDEMLKDPALELRARDLSAQLRCLVCQNESIDESDADLARDIRLLIRERITKGESNDQIRDFLVSRYGDFILLKPPLKPETLILWLSAPLTAEEQARLRELEGNGSSDSRWA